jgi:ribonucleoside-diphosphate reductase alpha chain
MVSSSVAHNLAEHFLTTNARTILEKRYLRKDTEGKFLETPDQLFLRVAEYVAQGSRNFGQSEEEIQNLTDVFYTLMAKGIFLPNSPTLVNAGTDKGCLSACFTRSPKDTMESIMEVAYDAAMIEKWGGGIGFSVGELRPKNDAISTTHGKALGAIETLKMYSYNASKITQGSFRLGAHMGLVPCLTGDTIISTLHGNVSIQALVGTRPYVYSVNNERVEVVQADKVFWSGKKKVVRVWLDNGNHIDCTPDHKFMLSNGEYKEARDLKTQDSLMAFHKKLNSSGKPRFHIFHTEGKIEKQYRVVARMKYGRELEHGDVIDHINNDSSDDSPENLQILNRHTHGKKTHQKDSPLPNMRGFRHSKETKELWNSQRVGQAAWNRGLTGDDYQKYYQNGFRNQHEFNQKVNKICLVCRQEFSVVYSKRDRKYCTKECQYIDWGKGNKPMSPTSKSNHKVFFVEDLNIEKDVYDISLPKYHNFVANEVFVHNCNHPEIFDFIHCKDTFEELQNFNISVQITDEFMECVKADSDWNLVNPKDGEVYKTVKARLLWNELCESAWKTGDPGLAFMDRVWETAPNPQLGKIIASNPCQEEWLEDKGNCCLGSINLSKFVNTNGEWDVVELDRVIRLAVTFLDNVIEVNQFPLESLREMNLKTRRIGLGVMGWADALIKLGIPYDSEEACDQAELIGSIIKNTAWEESSHLASIRGPYPEYENSALKSWGMPPVRNSSVVTIAPTGSISRIADTSSGIEPLYSIAWYSNILWEDQKGTSEKFVDCSSIIREEIEKRLSNPTSLQNVLRMLIEGDDIKAKHKELSDLDLSLFRTAFDVSPQDHVKMQAAWQKNTTNSVSKTINLPNNATIEDIKNVYMQAWESKCKGITIYRSGTREVEVLTTSSETKRKEIPFKKNDRPRTMTGTTVKYQTGHGVLYSTLNKNGVPTEVFSNLGKAGGCHTAYLESISRLISLALQSGVDYQDIIKQLEHITCCPVWDNGVQVKSPSDAIAKAMKECFSEKEGNYSTNGDSSSSDIAIFDGIQGCPDCSEKVIYSEGCVSCMSCGWSKCS